MSDRPTPLATGMSGRLSSSSTRSVFSVAIAVSVLPKVAGERLELYAWAADGVKNRHRVVDAVSTSMIMRQGGVTGEVLQRER